jgi:anti-sigma factor ChrR (cupin superfamily)
MYEDKLFDENGDFKTVKAEDIGVFDDLAAAAASAKAEFDALNGSLTENQTALAQSAGTIDELDAMLGSGQITKSIYDNQVAATAMAEAQAEGLDVEAVY